MPVFDMLETVLVKRFHFSPSLQLRLITRSIYVGKSFLHSSQKFFFKSLAGLPVRWNEGIIFVQDRRKLGRENLEFCILMLS
jgi:hypothetical protein